jgi:hypothetical protein
MDGIADKPREQKADHFGAVVQDKLHEPIDVSAEKEIPALGHRRNMHGNAALRAKFQGPDRVIERPGLPPNRIMSFRTIIVEAQINLIQPGCGQAIHVGFVDDVSVCFERHEKSIGFCAGDNIKKVVAQRRLATKQVDHKTSGKPEILEERINLTEGQLTLYCLPELRHTAVFAVALAAIRQCELYNFYVRQGHALSPG